ncbi:MAG: ATP-dependent helicase [Phycisphaerales bacterium JB040]
MPQPSLHNRPETDPAPPAPPAPEPHTLNEAQRRAVEHEGGPLVVLAGPGTGKTRVMIARIEHTLTARGADPESVLAVTFTNKAARELSDRLAGRIDPSTADRVRTSTIHRLGLSILTAHADRAGLPPSPELIDSSQQRLLLEELTDAHRLFRQLASSGIPSAIERAGETLSLLNNSAVSPADALAHAQARLAELESDGAPEARRERASLERFREEARLGGLFQRACLERGWVTFDDLMRLPAELLERDRLAADMTRAGARHVMVDEFQDVNAAQIRLLRALCPPATNPDLAVVGDDDQAIYRFRGSDEQSFTRFGRIWPTATTITLDTNYRSTQPVLDVANAIITGANSRFAPDKEIRRERAHEGTPPPVTAVRITEQKQSGEAIATAILRMRRGELHAKKGIAFSEMAVLCRTNTEAQRVLAELEVEGIPAVAARRPTPLDDAGVQDLFAWIDLLVNPAAPAEVLRLLTRPPVSADPQHAFSLVRAFRAVSSRARLSSALDDDPDPDPGDGPAPTFVAFLRERYADDPAARAFLAIAEELAPVATQARADEAVLRIIRRVGLMTADLIGDDDHLARATSVASVLRFARERVSRLEQPRDLRAFWRYYQRLSDKEKARFDPAGEARLETDEDANPDGRNAVSVVTAHSAKGLEFDTVFVARVVSGHGFPQSNRSEDAALPAGLGPADVTGLSGAQRHDDEERRVFYVACTRARRRLVLVGTTPKDKRSKSYMNELLRTPGLVEAIDASDLFLTGRARDELETEALEFRQRADARDLLDRACVEARRDAARALALAERDDGDRTPPEAMRALASAADRLRLVGQARRTGTVPGWAEDAGLSEFGETVRRALVGEAAPSRRHPVAGPLDLSYSKINLYDTCPRCYFVEHVLRLRDTTGPAQLVGTAVHEALHRFYDRWRAADAEGEPTPTLDDLQALAHRYFLESWPEDQEVDHRQLLQIRSQLDRFWERHHNRDLHIAELERDVRLRWALDGQTHTVRVKLDRVDLTPSGERIIDYKTGHPRDSLVNVKKTDLQMGLYMLALRQLRQDPELDGVCEYWLLQSGEVGPIAFADLNVDRISAKVDKAIRGILAGEFDRKSAGCTGPCAILDPL